jgi:hypothetical protein
MNLNYLFVGLFVYSRRTPFDLGVFHGNVITTRAFLQHDPSLALTDAGTSALHRAIAGHAANACVLANVVVSHVHMLELYFAKLIYG